MRDQALRFGAELRTAKVSRVDLSPWPFEVWVGDPDADEPTVLADALIVATGARSLMLGVPNEDRLLGYGVSTCATCDGFFFRDQHIAVVGGGDSALEEAIFLTRFASKVTVDPPARRAAGLQDHAGARLRQPQDRLPLELGRHRGRSATPRSAGVRLRDTVTGEESELDVTGLFVAIGHEPNTALFKGQLELEDNGYVRTFDGTTRTSVDGRLRLRRRPGPLLPPGRHRGRVGLHGRHRRRALARRARASSREQNRGGAALHPLTRRCHEREDRDPDRRYL